MTKGVFVSIVVGLSLVLLGPIYGVPSSEASAPCDYYASPTGTGNGRSSSTPFKIANFWPVATPGTTLCLLDGTYRGGAQMISPPSGLSGTQAHPITIRALNDGRVLIDGQRERRPVFIRGGWLVLEGFNACCSSENVLHTSYGSHDVTFRRIVAWDAKDDPSTSYHVVNIVYSPDVLLEDVGAFGRGRKTFQFIGEATDGTVCRRCWGQWEGYESTFSKPRGTLQPSYRAPNTLIENSLMTWTAEQIPQQIGQADAVIYVMNEMPGLLRVLGSVGYVKCDAASFHSSDIFDNTNANVGNVLLEDVIAVYQPGCFTTKLGFNLRNATGPIMTVRRATTWGGSGTNYIGSTWKQTNVCASPNFPGSCSNPYTGVNAANVCKRYVNGVRTSEPLWPWPMNQRILDATRTGSHTAVDVTAEIQEVLGPIPSVCRK